MNLVEQIGGFNDEKRYRAEAITERFFRSRIRFTAEFMNIGALNLAGRTALDSFNFGFDWTHPRFSLAAGRTHSNGRGAFFPFFTVTPLPSVPLPVDQLINTPLLDRVVRSTYAHGALFLKRNLQIRGEWRRERNVLSASSQNYQRYIVSAEYRIGKVSIMVGWSQFDNDVFLAASASGNRTRRFVFRITRDFRVF
jgi:hypothetical protein